MASSGKKKVDLRELMKKQRAESKSTTKRIESPLAKYNSIGQIVCVVCNCQVKNEIVWPVHLQGKKHKENLAALRPGNTPNVSQQRPVTSQPQPASLSTTKRKAEHEATSTISDKKPKGSTQPGSTKGLPAGFFDSEIKSPPSVDASKKPSYSSVAETAVSSSLPSDFFDSGMPSRAAPKIPGDEVNASNSSTDKSKERKASSTAEAIPEGFFDDPVMDAKVRNVEVKNTMEEEWSKFQKEMAEENQVSENIQVENEEAAQVDRNIDEIDEQIHCFAKVEALRDKQDNIKSQVEARKLQHPTKSEEEEGDSVSADEAEFEEFLDWRSKGAWK